MRVSDVRLRGSLTSQLVVTRPVPEVLPDVNESEVRLVSPPEEVESMIAFGSSSRASTVRALMPESAQLDTSIWLRSARASRYESSNEAENDVTSPRSARRFASQRTSLPKA